MSFIITNLLDSTETKENKEGALAAMLILGLPSIATGTWLIWGLSQQHQKQLQQKNLDREQLFLRLLQQQEGEITIVNFALTAQIPIEEAKHYLNEKAKQLNANFEASDRGEIIYKFPH